MLQRELREPPGAAHEERGGEDENATGALVDDGGEGAVEFRRAPHGQRLKPQP